MSEHCLTAESVSYSIRGKRLVSQLDITVKPGELVALIGPNGAGKSTALKLLSGELPPITGNVLLNGTSVQAMKPQALALQRSVMAQAVQVVFDFTVQEIIEMGWVQGRTLPSSLLATAVSEVVQRCGLQEFLPRRFNSLSGGEQQRVQFARNVLQLWRPVQGEFNPRYLLLDEPTASMDLRHELSLLTQLQSVKQQNVGVLVVMHDLNLAARFMDRVLLMQDGQIVKAGEPETVFQAELLTDVYQTPIKVEMNRDFDRLVIHT